MTHKLRPPSIPKMGKCKAQGLPVRSIFYNFDALATTKHHRIDLIRYQNDISVIITTGAAAKSHNFKKRLTFLFLNFIMICANEFVC